MPEYNGNELAMEDFVERVCDDMAVGGEDREIAGIAAAYGALRSLTDSQQHRVLAWLNDKIASEQRRRALPEPTTWRCSECGTEYMADVGRCGNLTGCSQPSVVPVYPEAQASLSQPDTEEDE